MCRCLEEGVSGEMTMPLPRELLDLSYLRPCFVCKRQGWCPHREPEVEYAIFSQRTMRKEPGVEQENQRGKVGTRAQEETA